MTTTPKTTTPKTTTPDRTAQAAIGGSSFSGKDALFRSVSEAAPVAIVTIDARGAVQSFSPAAERLFGYREDEIVGRNVAALMPEPHASAHDGYIARYLETGEARIIGLGRRATAKHKDGGLLPVRLSVGRFTQNGAPFFVGFIEDIRAAEEARARLDELQHELAHVSRASAAGVMAGAIAHEVNQPLTAGLSFAEAADFALEKAGEGAEGPIRKKLRQSIGEMRRAGEILRGIRNFLATMPPEKRKQNLNAVVREAVGFAFARMPKDAIAVTMDLATNLPPVEIDRVRIQQVVLNLVRNAIEAVGDAATKEITVRTVANGGFAEIRVEDSGAGVPDAVKDRLFQPFVTTKRASGMGLGLAICRSIAEAHDGGVDAWPGERQGMVFAVRLPIGDGS